MAGRFALLFLLACHFLDSVMSTRNFTIENKCEYTIWPASYTYQGSLETNAFRLDKGQTRTVQATSSWIGQFWGRTLCTTNSSGGFSCITGDCNSGKLECSDRVRHQWLQPPLLVTPENEKCESIGCSVDLNKTCPSELRLSNSDTGSNDPFACRTSCQQNMSAEICCVGNYVLSDNVVGPEECKRTNYSQTFNNVCPRAYSYAYDTNSSTFTCQYSSNFVITFCPSSTTKLPPLVSPPPNKTRAGSRGISPLKLTLILGVSSVFSMIIIIAIVVKKMTKSFANVLGRGGFGTVYKGKLPDGSRDVAVKILKEANGNGEEFINEVASMSRTSHVNIVSLLGFCYEGSKKAIIYEFMPNGSLDKFISEKMSTKMEWKTLYNIAVGVSHGLEYLHDGCISRIVHFDIKPQNILISGDSCPKISDFGLAKLCKNNESIMSMLDARGTVGYIAPEVFSKNFGGVSHKSDVYSYGMVVLEMIGARERAENTGTNNTSMYFPDWIYKDLEEGEIMSVFADQIIEEEDEKIVKKMVYVGLWCIQTNPADRPPMSKVVEMLEGSLEALQIPPKPLLFLPAETVPKTTDEIPETSSFSIPSHQDTLHYIL
ncbi:Osmotin/thaumatin-like superfamily [Arabidopsis thaliana x Arabidopsis arenosa]|uniref:Osmotin/thaumatin-like superfamily n=1 Tax=Arabidopsis thaliana x Arabidopsis arenosa TaxID=1240361 RepID=A0A8T2A9S9_9BRAS|nr:Osmotin/thaumatin-like superfamily [Arabidopsis thaliana x Arabidopsis arenosa]